ncbi:MAG TPA: NAD-dependent epimerase/dehydratase family protein [Candidatus Polarisedimenticolia bacterium]|nr:NAD-dependent epimerase/dehydratase family protein [Candidatus Polarisedimenticolia bacterium]
MRIAITGAGGFIGSHLLERALQRGFEVRAHLGPPDAAVHEPPAGVRGVRASIDDPAPIRSLVEGAEVVIHLAGPASVAASWSDPAGCVRAHVDGTANVLEACRAQGVGRFVSLSSAEVYAADRPVPVGEDDPVGPRSPYGAAKLAAEHLVGAYARGCGLAARVLRLFSVFGPRQRAGVVDHICRQALAAGAIELQAPDVVRDFCYVDDVSDAVLLAVRATAQGGLATLNIGRGQGLRIEALAARAQAVLGVPSRVRRGSGPPRPAGTDVPYLVADTRRALEVLGWSPQTSLDEGLRRTFATLGAGVAR